MQDLSLAVSDSGPNHELHVYQRRSGKIVWREDSKGNPKVHAKILKIAKLICLNGPTRVVGK